jgi:hypothetical protein
MDQKGCIRRVVQHWHNRESKVRGSRNGRRPRYSVRRTVTHTDTFRTHRRGSSLESSASIVCAAMHCAESIAGLPPEVVGPRGRYLTGLVEPCGALPRKCFFFFLSAESIAASASVGCLGCICHPNPRASSEIEAHTSSRGGEMEGTVVARLRWNSRSIPRSHP